MFTSSLVIDYHKKTQMIKGHLRNNWTDLFWLFFGLWKLLCWNVFTTDMVCAELVLVDISWATMMPEQASKMSCMYCKGYN